MRANKPPTKAREKTFLTFIISCHRHYSNDHVWESVKGKLKKHGQKKKCKKNKKINKKNKKRGRGISRTHPGICHTYTHTLITLLVIKLDAHFAN